SGRVPPRPAPSPCPSTTLFRSADAAAVAAARFGGANGRLAGGNRLLAGGNGGPGVAAARGRLKEVEAVGAYAATAQPEGLTVPRSEEHTSELQSRENLVCRLLL